MTYIQLFLDINFFVWMDYCQVGDMAAAPGQKPDGSAAPMEGGSMILSKRFGNWNCLNNIANDSHQCDTLPLYIPYGHIIPHYCYWESR